MIIKIIRFLVVCNVALSGYTLQAQPKLAAKHQPVSENLLKGAENTVFPILTEKNEGKGKWRHYQKGCYGNKENRRDLRVKHPSYDKGTGAIRIGVFEPHQPTEWLIDLKNCAKTANKTKFSIKDFIQYGKISVLPNTFYTFSVRALTTNVKPSNSLNLSITELKEGNVHQAYSISKENSWEELVLFFKTGSKDTHVQLTISAFPQVDGSETPIYVDDLYFGKGIGFRDHPIAKTPFQGARVRVDSLSNIEVYLDGKWEPYFPIGIYGANKQIDLDLKTPNQQSLYQNLGFDMLMRAEGGYYEKAVALGIPWINIDITSYLYPIRSNKVNIQDFQPLIDYLNKLDPKHIFAFYHDNEKTRTAYNKKAVLYSLLHEKFPEIPIYALNGTYGNTPRWNKSDNSKANIDITGTYLGHSSGVQKMGEMATIPLNFITLDQQSNQTVPPSFAQINSASTLWRPRVYSAIAHGAKGIAYYKDCFDCEEVNQMPINELPWINDVIDVKKEIQMLLPVIREPHWTSWKVSLIDAEGNAINNPTVDFGTRNYKGNAYIIISNFNPDKTQTINFKFSNTDFNGCEVYDFFEGVDLGLIHNKKLKVEITRGGSKVLKIIRR